MLLPSTAAWVAMRCVRKKGRNLLSELGDAAVLSAGAFQAGENISSRNAETMFAVFKRNQKLVAVFLPVEGTDLETVVRTARKITHYGRYGRLSFKNGINTGKGVGEVSGSPLVVDLERRRVGPLPASLAMWQKTHIAAYCRAWTPTRAFFAEHRSAATSKDRRLQEYNQYKCRHLSPILVKTC